MRSQWKEVGKGKSEITFFKHLDFSGFDSLLCFDVFMFKLNVQSHNDTIFTKCVGRIAAVAVTQWKLLDARGPNLLKNCEQCLFDAENTKDVEGFKWNKLFVSDTE